MTVQTRDVQYEGPGGPFHGRLAWDDAGGARPGVLVAPTFMNRSPFEDGKAETLAGLGYAALTVDIYGQGKRAGSVEEASQLMMTLQGNRQLLADRMTAAWNALKAAPEVDAARTAAIGYCFGGKCVLDLARTGADLKGVAAFHGIFDAPNIPMADKIGAKVLAMHGWDDDLAKPEAVLALAKELTEKGADWQLHAYGHTGHAFTNTGRPDMYRAEADRRSWAALTDFLGELFG